MKTTKPVVLVVDDDEDTCRNLSDILSDLGYEVDTAPDGPSALELVRRRAYDVAILDYRMPGMDGLTLYREIRKMRSGTVAIVVTAYSGHTTPEETLAAGVWQVLAKPVDFQHLLGLLNEAVGQPLVLIVDDDQDLCANLWDLLRDRGYRVSLAHDADEAARHLNDTPFQAVLIDVRLPQDDGTAVLKAVQQINPEARTLVITGYPAEADRIVKRMLDEGADAVCYKPFDVPNLLQTLEQLTRSATPGATRNV